MPAVSVIIPTHNRRAILPRAVESVLKQTWSDWELIVVDDGSIDGTSEWLASLNEPRLRLLRLSQQKGVSFARNRGVEWAQAPWLAFLDSDDEWLPKKLEIQLQMIKQNPALSWLHGEEIWVRNGVRVNPMRKHQKSGGDIFMASLELCCVSPSAVMIERDFFAASGGFREDFVVCEDYDLWLKLSACKPIGYTEEPLLRKYGGHADQLSHRYRAMDLWRIEALRSCLAELPLADKRHEAVVQVLLRKLSILLKGCRRHQNLQNYEALFHLKRQIELENGAVERT